MKINSALITLAAGLRSPGEFQIEQLTVAARADVKVLCGHPSIRIANRSGPYELGRGSLGRRQDDARKLWIPQDKGIHCDDSRTRMSGRRRGSLALLRDILGIENQQLHQLFPDVRWRCRASWRRRRSRRLRPQAFTGCQPARGEERYSPKCLHWVEMAFRSMDGSDQSEKLVLYSS